jgi:hypothetical protein
MKRNGAWRAAAHVLAVAALGVLAVVSAYMLAVRPWQARWGATGAELTQALPGDLLVARPREQTTRAITIEAPAATVWPWLVQMGQGRGGLYSYEMLENLLGCDIHNADRIVPEWQDTAVGDRVRIYPEGSGPPPYTVAEIVPGTALVTGHSTDPGGVPDQVTPQTQWSDTWAFILQPVDERSTRLIVRARSSYQDPVMRAVMAVIEPGYFLMERGMLAGIKARAERAAGAPSEYTAADGWSVGLLLAALAALALYLFVGQWPHKLAIFPLAATLWTLALFFGFPSPLLAGASTLVALAALASTYLFARRAGSISGAPGGPRTDERGKAPLAGDRHLPGRLAPGP